MSEALVYFVNSTGKIIIPAVTSTPTPVGFERRTVRSMYEIEYVSKLFTAQKQRMFDSIDEAAALKLEAKMTEVRSRMHHRMQITHSQFEKDFIRYALKRLEEDEHKVRTRRYEMHLQMEAQEAPLK